MFNLLKLITNIFRKPVNSLSLEFLHDLDKELFQTFKFRVNQNKIVAYYLYTINLFRLSVSLSSQEFYGSSCKAPFFPNAPLTISS